LLPRRLRVSARIVFRKSGYHRLGIVSAAGFSMQACRIVIASPPSWPSRSNYVFKPTGILTRLS
jgi:hypothetical protein